MAELIPFLDVPSTLALATVQPFVLDMLQHGFIWRDRLRRSSLEDYKEEEDERVRCESEGEESEIGTGTLENRRIVGQLVEIFQMMVVDPEPRLLELLEIICERFSEDYKKYWNSVLVSCDRHSEHRVSKEGFYLLEMAEGTLGKWKTNRKRAQFWSKRVVMAG